jgi:hypothetical protein
MKIFNIQPSARLYSLILLIGLFVGVTSALFPITAHAQDTEPPPPPVLPDMDTNTLLSILVTLAAAWLALPGVRGVIVAIVNIGKSVGIVRDGTAPRWFAALNLILFVGVGLLIVFGPLKTEALDSQLGMLATILTLLGAFVSQIVQAPETSDAVKALKIPGVSTSHSGPPTITRRAK